jgi:N-acetylglucosamine kinase-like BadF-type ATPase
LAVHRYVVGIDGGASKTVALIGSEDGRILGRGIAGSSNYHNIGPHAATLAIRKAVSEAKRAAGISGKKPEIAVVALAAVDSPKDKAEASRFVKQASIARRSYVVHDSVAALYAATKGKPGIIVISGTGSVAAGVNRAGEYARAGGWGYIVDDEGSAYDMVRKALTKAFRMLDGRDPPTRLVSLFKRKFRVKTLENALRLFYVDGMGVEQIARLAPIISKAASRDGACREILNNAGIRLAELACAVARRLDMTQDKVTIAVFGGNFKSGRNLLEPFEARIREECPHAHIIKPTIEPAQGAFALGVSLLRKERPSKSVDAGIASPFRT